MLQVRDLTIRHGSATPLRDVSVDVVPGEVVAVVGPNGAGKSTLLEAMAGDRRPVAGAVCCNGRPLTAWPPRDLARVRAVMLQRCRLEFAFTALEVVLLGRAPHGERGDRGIAAAALELVDAGALRHRRYPTLSGGERQRVQFARALAQIWEAGDAAPDRYLLLDEPTAALDLQHQHQLLVQARAWARNGTGVLVVLHDLNLAAAHADRIVVLSRGALAAAGPPFEVLRPRLIAAVFGVEVVVTDHPDTGTPFILPRLESARWSP